MPTPTIMQIVPKLDTGGAELSAIEISEAVVRAGGRAIIATQGGRLEASAQKQGAEIYRFPAASKNPVCIVANSAALARVSKEENVQLFHARSRAPAWSALWAARIARLPFVTTYHGAYNENSPLKRFYNSVMARGDIVIANSKFTADLIQKRYQTPSDKLRVIYRGVDTAFEAAKISDKRVADLKASWGVTAGQRIILQAARLTGWKGQRIVIEAAAQLANMGKLEDVVFILAGDSQGREAYRHDLENLIVQLDVQRHVKLVGHVSDIAAAFAAAHLSVVASTEPEAFGRAGAEAQALGCLVIATRLGAPQETVLALPEVARDERTGWLVEAGNAEALAAAFTEALTLSQEERSNMGKRAIRHVHTHYALEQMKRKTLEIYDQLLRTNLADNFDSASKR